MNLRRQLQSQTRLFVYSGFLTVAAIAVVVLYGWSQDISILKTLLPGRPDMKANTALCFLLMALSMFLCSTETPRNFPGARWIGMFLASVTCIFSALVLVEYGWNVDLGIDQLIFVDTNTHGHSPPGRFAPITALNFILLAMGVLLDKWPRAPFYRTSQAMLMLSFLISLQSFLGAALGTPEIFGLGVFIPMAIQTSFSFSVLSLSFLALRAQNGFMQSFTADNPSAVMSRRMMISVVLVPPLIRGLSSMGFQAGLYGEGFASFVHTMGSMIFITVIVTATATALLKHEQERDRLRQSEQAAYREALAASQAKSQFLANMSHEIRTPLGVILGFSDLGLESVQNPNEVRNYLGGIRRNAEALSKLLGEILDLSKVEARKLEIEKIKIPLMEAVHEVIDSLQVKALEKGLRIEILQQGDLPTTIETDPTRLRQILINLVGNAVKFTERGFIKIMISKQTELPGPKNLIRFTVQDSGIGISPEQRERLFKPFSQADSSMTRRFGGTGLGLTLSKELALALGGDLELMDSALGVGTTFSVRIDAGELERELSVETSATNPSPRTSEDPSHLLKGLRVLLVEDAVENQMLIEHYLTPAGVILDVAANGGEGVQKALHGPYDLVLMDIQMPLMDGFQATRKLRDHGFDRPIIALTAHALHEEKLTALKSGFNEYLTKPISKETLVQTLSVFRSHQSV